MFARAGARVAGVVAAATLILVGGVLIVKDQQQATPVEPASARAVSAHDLSVVAGQKVFFGHQSVGMNVIAGIPDLYVRRDLPAPTLLDLGQGQLPDQQDAQGGYFAHAFLGQNGDPLGKIADFDARIRNGLGRDADVAFMKFCYVDINSGTDVDHLFDRYRTTMDALERAFPQVVFVHVTTPLTTEPDLKARVKSVLGRNDGMGPADNAARERFNSLMRREYHDDHLFDLAALESTAPDGTRVGGKHGGQAYFALYDGYAADPGHLNAAGSHIAAAELLRLIARSAQEPGR